MLDLKPRLDEPEVQALLALSVFPASGRLERAVEAYRAAARWVLLGLELEGVLVGCIGIEPSSGTVLNIGVHPDRRGQGFGRALIEEASRHLGLTHLEAETDQSAVEFYRHCGFEITSLGEQHPGVERFRCVLDIRWVVRWNEAGQPETISARQAARDIQGLYADRIGSWNPVDELIAERRLEVQREEADSASDDELPNS